MSDRSLSGEVTRRTSAVFSLHTVQESKLHSTGFRLPKSTSFRRDEGNLADKSCIEYLLADTLFKRLCSLLFDENSPLSNFCFA